MRLCFSTNEKYYSKFMKFLFKEPTSHVGAGFVVQGCPLIVDCTKPCGKLYHQKHWDKKYKTVYFVDIQLSEDDEKLAFYLVTDNAVLKPYDWDAYFYGFLLGILWKWGGIKPPTYNRFSSKDADLCTEIVNPIKPLLCQYGINLEGKDMAAMTPHMMAAEIYEQTKSNERVRWYGFPAQATGEEQCRDWPVS